MKRKRVTAKLRLHPDPILTKVCEPVKDGEDVSGIIRDMMHVLTNSKSGVGLAAPQAGHLKRVIIVNLVAKYNNYRIMINPEFQSEGNHKNSAKERCLSYPGKVKTISRPTYILTSFNDDNGQFQTSSFTHYQARIIQHEIDHLDGKFKVGEK